MTMARYGREIAAAEPRRSGEFRAGNVPTHLPAIGSALRENKGPPDEAALVISSKGLSLGRAFGKRLGKFLDRLGVLDVFNGRQFAGHPVQR